MSNKTYEVICEHCGNQYTAKSLKSKFCGTNCRVAAYRSQHPEDTPSPELRITLDTMVRSMRIRIRPLDVEVEWTKQTGQSYKQWFEFEKHPRLENLWSYGNWNLNHIRYLISSRESES